ncbi:MAG: capsular biosynthesis protein, partial [Sphingomonas sp.]|nr:capsular biosynthesis protein [Sphingomonas sp.]
MNTNITVRSEGQWPIAPYPADAAGLAPGQRTYSAAAKLDFPGFIRILYHWRWLVLGAVAIGLAGAIITTLLTKPVYRAQVTLEANPPAVAVSDEQSRQQDMQATNAYDFVATQVGLLGSEAVAERTTQELNLANNPDVVSQDGDASQRLRTATGIVRGGLKVTAPDQGQLISFTYESTSPQLAALVANGIADSFINTSLQRRYEASAYARNFLERQINK